MGLAEKLGLPAPRGRVLRSGAPAPAPSPAPAPANAQAAYLRRKGQVQALVNALMEVFDRTVLGRTAAVFTEADRLANASPPDHAGAMKLLDELEQNLSAGFSRWSYEEVAGDLEAARNGPAGAFVAEDLRQLDALKLEGEAAARARDWTRAIFVRRTLRRRAETVGDVARRRAAFETERTSVVAKLAALRGKPIVTSRLAVLEPQLVQADKLAERSVMRFEQGGAALRRIGAACDVLSGFATAAEALATERGQADAELAALRKLPQAGALAEPIAAAEAAMRQADTTAQAAASLADPRAGTEAARAMLVRLRADLAVAKATGAQLAPALALQAGADKAASATTIRTEAGKLRKAFTAAAKAPGAERAAVPLEVGEAALALADTELAARRVPQAGEALRAAAQALLRARSLQADAARHAELRKAIQSRMATLRAQPVAAAIAARIDAVDRALAEAQRQDDATAALTALHAAEDAAGLAEQAAVARAAFDHRIQPIEQAAKGVTDGVGVDFDKRIAKARSQADGFQFDAARATLDRAETMWETVKVNLLAASDPSNPALREGAKRLVALGDEKAVDALVAHLPDSVPEYVIAEIAQARFGVRFNLTRGDQASAGGKRVYAMLAKAPQDVKGNPSLKRVHHEPRVAGQAVGGKYDPEEEGASTWGRPKSETQKFGAALKGPNKRPQLPARIEKEYQPVNDTPVEQLDWAALHELGHTVDDATGFMTRRGKDDDCGAWIEYGARVEPVAAAVAGWAGFGASAEMNRYVLDLLHGSKPTRPAPPPDAGAKWDGALRKVDGWFKEATRPDLWFDHAASIAICIGERIYQRPYPDEWVSYKAVARQRGLTGFQFKAPGEWFAELYAGYRIGKLKPEHPAVRWLSTLRI